MAARGRTQIRYQGRSQAVARRRPKAAQAEARTQSPPRQVQASRQATSAAKRTAAVRRAPLGAGVGRGGGGGAVGAGAGEAGEVDRDAQVAGPALFLPGEAEAVHPVPAEREVSDSRD